MYIYQICSKEMNKTEPHKGYSLPFSQPWTKPECVVCSQSAKAYAMFVEDTILQIL